MAEHYVPHNVSILDGNQGNDDVTLIAQPFDQSSLCAAAKYIGYEVADRSSIGLTLSPYSQSKSSRAERAQHAQSKAFSLVTRSAAS